MAVLTELTGFLLMPGGDVRGEMAVEDTAMSVLQSQWPCGVLRLLLLLLCCALVQWHVHGLSCSSDDPVGTAENRT